MSDDDRAVAIDFLAGMHGEPKMVEETRSHSSARLEDRRIPLSGASAGVSYFVVGGEDVEHFAPVVPSSPRDGSSAPLIVVGSAPNDQSSARRGGRRSLDP